MIRSRRRRRSRWKGIVIGEEGDVGEENNKKKEGVER